MIADRSAEPVLRASNLVKRFGATVAVDDVSFTVGPGEVVTLLGPSGCGKSSTLRAVAGLEPLDGGEIELGGRVVSSAARGVFVAPERRNVGVVFQSYAIWPHMTVGENVGYPLRLRGVPAAERHRKVAEMLDMVGLADYASRSATKLSGGQQQRVALARALCYEPTILLLDEPLSNLDAQLRPELLAQIHMLQRQRGTAVLFVTHDQAEAMTVSHRIAVMREGHIEQIGPPLQIYEHPATAFVQHFIGRTVSLPGVMANEGVLVDGQLLALDHIFCQELGGLPPGREVIVTSRPEAVTLTHAPTGPCALPGVVEETTYLGDRIECEVSVGGCAVRVGVDKGGAGRPGDRVYLTLDASRVKIWAA